MWRIRAASLFDPAARPRASAMMVPGRGGELVAELDAPRVPRAPVLRGKVRQCDGPLLAEDHGALDEVLQLADVSRPPVRPQRGGDLRGEGQALSARRPARTPPGNARPVAGCHRAARAAAGCGPPPRPGGSTAPRGKGRPRWRPRCRGWWPPRRGSRCGLSPRRPAA